MKKKIRKFYAWVVLVCALGLLACDPGLVMCAPVLVATAPITIPGAVIAGGMSDSYVQNIKSEETNQYADKNGDGHVDYAEMEALMLELKFTKEQIEKSVPKSECYKFSFRYVGQDDNLIKINKPKKQAIIILGISESKYSIIEPPIRKNFDDKRNETVNKYIKRITKFADKNNDERLDIDEIKNLLIAAGIKNRRLDKELNSWNRYNEFEIALSRYRDDDNIDLFNNDDKKITRIEFPFYRLDQINKKLGELEQKAKEPPNKSKFGKNKS